MDVSSTGSPDGLAVGDEVAFEIPPVEAVIVLLTAALLVTTLFDAFAPVVDAMPEDVLAALLVDATLEVAVLTEQYCALLKDRTRSDAHEAASCV